MCVILGIPYIFFSSLRVMPKILTALQLPIAHDDDITRQLENCNENNKFAVYPYSMLREFVVDSEVIVTSMIQSRGIGRRFGRHRSTSVAASQPRLG